mgnify:FL=1
MADEKDKFNRLDKRDREIARWISRMLGYDIQILSSRLRQQAEVLRGAGLSEQSIARFLSQDLSSGGRIFGEFRGALKRGVVGGVMQASRRELNVGGDVNYRWVVAQGVENCEDCLGRAGEVDTWDNWVARGMPGTGWSVCRVSCYCQIVPETTDIDDVIKIRGK